MTSLCSVKPSPLVPARATSSVTIHWKRRSGVPPPPYSSGTSMASRPVFPAASQMSRLTWPCFSHSGWCGTASFSRKSRTICRKSVCSSEKIVRSTGWPLLWGRAGAPVGPAGPRPCWWTSAWLHRPVTVKPDSSALPYDRLRSRLPCGRRHRRPLCPVPRPGSAWRSPVSFRLTDVVRQHASATRPGGADVRRSEHDLRRARPSRRPGGARDGGRRARRRGARGVAGQEPPRVLRPALRRAPRARRHRSVEQPAHPRRADRDHRGLRGAARGARVPTSPTCASGWARSTPCAASSSSTTTTRPG